MNINQITRAAIKWRKAKIQLSSDRSLKNNHALTEAQLILEKLLDNLIEIQQKEKK